MLNTFAKWIFKKENIIILIIIALFILFHEPIENLINQTIVQHVLVYVKSDYYRDVVFCLAPILSILFVYHKFKKYRPSQNIIYTLILFSVIYLFYRCVSNVWEFTPFYIFPRLKYVDVLIAITLINFVLFIKDKFDLPNDDPFFVDNSLEDSQGDILGYKNYAISIAGKIKTSSFKKNAFAIGINGKWGIGKTSFFNIIKEGLRKDDSIIEIDFKPWMSNSPNLITQDFFDLLQEKLAPYNSVLSRQLNAYSNKLIEIDDTAFTRVLKETASLITGVNSTNTLFEQIHKSILRLNKKIVFYIDDVDRLNNLEVIEVIRLIRNTANFGHVFFIVAYDRNYIINSLREQNQYRVENYLDKIFQVEITLPYFEREKLRQKFFTNLKLTFKANFHDEIKKAILGSSSSNIPKYIDNWIENVRDVTRLSNILTLNMQGLIGEVVFSDFMDLQILRMKYPAVYELIHRNVNEIFETNNESSKNNVYILRTDSTTGKKQRIVPTDTNLYKLLDNDRILYGISQNEIDKIVTLVDKIFGDKISYLGRSSKSSLSVRYPSKFYRYFSYDLLDNQISYVDFSNARGDLQSAFYSKIDEWVKKGIVSEIKYMFESITNFDNNKDYENVINSIFYLGRMTEYVNRKVRYSDLLLNYDSDDLYYKLENNKKHNELYNDDNGLRDFVFNLFEKAPFPYVFESSFIADVLYRYYHPLAYVFPLGQDELQLISANYFKLYVNKINKFDSNVWDLFNYSKINVYTEIRDNSYRKEKQILSNDVKNVMIEFIKNKDLDSFLFDVINNNNRNDGEFSISESVIDIFDGWNEFEEYINKVDETKYLYVKEFKLFYDVFKEKSFKIFVPFEFNDIPVKTKLKTWQSEPVIIK